ncbi:MAG: DNA primase [Acidobacteriota bacterium]
MSEAGSVRGGSTPFSRFVDEVRQSADLVSLVSSSVSLKRSGSKFKGLCPFHQEKTPSFSLDEAKQLFYCFGCGKGGDAFKFLMLQEKVDFAEAARLLGQRFGVRPPERNPARAAARERLSAALDAALGFFRQRLLDSAAGEAARTYLKKRGVTDETARCLSLGYAPSGWEALRGALMARGFTQSVLVESGLLVPRESGGAYDRFRNRLVFPIRSVSGRCVGFGGRALDEQEPKYLNSPESPAYRKGEHLFGLHLSGPAVRAQGIVVLVEGYMDFLSVYQAGVENVAATLGTAFTDSQAALLRRFGSTAVLGFDSDQAGALATRRTLEKLLPLGFAVRVLELPVNHDPDSFVREHGPEALRHEIEGAPGWLQHLLGRALAERGVRSLEARVALVEELGPLILKTPNRLERAAHVAVLAQRIGVEEATLWSELRRRSERGRQERPSALAAVPDERPAELRLVKSLLEEPGWQPRWIPRIQESDFGDLRAQRIVGLLADGVHAGECRGTGEVLRLLGDDPARDLLARFAVEATPAACEEEVEACVQALERCRLQRERRLVQEQMEGEKDPARIGMLMQRKIRISRAIDALS